MQESHSTYVLANILLALLHVIYAVTFAYGVIGRPLKKSWTAKLSLPLTVFFASGVVTHLSNALNPDETDAHLGWLFAMRTVVVMGCLPMTKWALDAIKHLPTKEQYDESLKQRDEQHQLAQRRITQEIARLDQLNEELSGLRLDVNDRQERDKFRTRVDALVARFQDVRVELEQERSEHDVGNGSAIR